MALDSSVHRLVGLISFIVETLGRVLELQLQTHQGQNLAHGKNAREQRRGRDHDYFKGRSCQESSRNR